MLDVGIPDNSTFCGYNINGQLLSMECFDRKATMDKVLFASYGTPQGSCGNYTVGSCNADNSTNIIESSCLGRRYCTINTNTKLFGDPCHGVVKYLAVEVHCSSGSGAATGGATTSVLAQAYTASDGSNHRLLLVNKTPRAQSIVFKGATGNTVIIVDDTRPTGPPINITLTRDVIAMRPYAVFVVLLK